MTPDGDRAEASLVFSNHSVTDKPGRARPLLSGRRCPSAGSTSQAPVDLTGGGETAAWPPLALMCPLCAFGAVPSMVLVVFGNHTSVGAWGCGEGRLTVGLGQVPGDHSSSLSLLRGWTRGPGAWG